MSQQEIIGDVAGTRATSAAPVAVIGPSLVVRGEVTGDEDVLVRGRVEGPSICHRTVWSSAMTDVCLPTSTPPRLKSTVMSRVIFVAMSTLLSTRQVTS